MSEPIKTATEVREAAAGVCDMAVHGLRVLAGTLRRDGETAAAADCSASAARIEVVATEIRALPCDDETERLRGRWALASAALRAIGHGMSGRDAGAVARNALAAAHGHTDPGAQEARAAADEAERLPPLTPEGARLLREAGFRTDVAEVERLRARVRRLEEAIRDARRLCPVNCAACGRCVATMTVALSGGGEVGHVG